MCAPTPLYCRRQVLISTTSFQKSCAAVVPLWTTAARALRTCPGLHSWACLTMPPRTAWRPQIRPSGRGCQYCCLWSWHRSLRESQRMRHCRCHCHCILHQATQRLYGPVACLPTRCLPWGQFTMLIPHGCPCHAWFYRPGTTLVMSCSPTKMGKAIGFASCEIRCAATQQVPARARSASTHTYTFALA